MFYRLEDLKGWPVVALNDGTIIKAEEVIPGLLRESDDDPQMLPVLTLKGPYEVLSVPRGENEVHLIGPRIYVPFVSVAYWTD